MCELCEEAENGIEYCQDCGVMICFDIKGGDDILAQAYVTASGDLFCIHCGRQYDEDEEAEYEDDYYPYPY